MNAREVLVGVLGSSPGWTRVLEQERIRHVDADVDRTPVVVLEGRLPSWTADYVAAGGVAVVSGALPGEDLLPPGSIASVTGFTPPGSGRRVWAPSLATLFEADGAGELRLHEDRVVKYEVDPDVFPAVITVRRGRGAVVASGIPLAMLLHAGGDRLRRFSRFTEVTERVASVDKADIADTLLGMLRTAFALAELPMVTVPRFPEGARSVLIFRVDVDGVYGENVSRLAQGVTAHAIAASFYLNADLSAAHPGTLSGWDDTTELGSHGGLHTLLPTVGENIENLRAAEAWMADVLGLTPTSFVGPRGLWNRHLGEALATLGYTYSSDFALDFDSLPFRSDAGVLQVPVHPYSPERAVVWAREQGLAPPSAADVARHYVKVVDDHVGLGRPAHVYGHPEVLGGMADEVLPALSAAAARHALPRMTLGQYAEFWQQREQVTPHVTVESDRVVVSVPDDGLGGRVQCVSELPVVVNGRPFGRTG